MCPVYNHNNQNINLNIYKEKWDNTYNDISTINDPYYYFLKNQENGGIV